MGGDLRASQSGSGGYHRQGFTGALGQCREGAGEGCRRGGGGRREAGGGGEGSAAASVFVARQHQQENSNRVPRPWMFASKLGLKHQSKSSQDALRASRRPYPADRVPHPCNHTLHIPRHPGSLAVTTPPTQLFYDRVPSP